MNEEILKPYVRPVTDEDRKRLPKYSYSKIETFLHCPMSFNYKYGQEMYSSDTSIALELGSLCHYVLEQKGKCIITNNTINYNDLQNILVHGTINTDEKTKEHLLGIEELKKKYWEVWYEPDSEGNTYNDKLNIFENVLYSEMNPEKDFDWCPVALEQNFEYVWDDRAIIHGFIDRIDMSRNDQNLVKTIDYKTSKKVYDNSKLATSLQFGFYACAILNTYGILPSENEYHFVFLDKIQKALTKGWEKRFIKKVTKTFDAIDENTKSGIWSPNPSPLCAWCNFSVTNPNATEYKDICNYYSLWTPTNKTFEVNKKWGVEEDKPARKLVF